MSFLRLGKTKINYIQDSSNDVYILSDIIDSSCSPEQPKLIRTVDELVIFFGTDWNQYDYYRELIQQGVTLFLYKSISSSRNYGLNGYLDIESWPVVEVNSYEELPGNFNCSNQIPRERVKYTVPIENTYYIYFGDEWYSESMISQNIKIPENSLSWLNRDSLRLNKLLQEEEADSGDNRGEGDDFGNSTNFYIGSIETDVDGISSITSEMLISESKSYSIVSNKTKSVTYNANKQLFYILLPDFISWQSIKYEDSSGLISELIYDYDNGHHFDNLIINGIQYSVWDYYNGKCDQYNTLKYTCTVKSSIIPSSSSTTTEKQPIEEKDSVGKEIRALSWKPDLDILQYTHPKFIEYYNPLYIDVEFNNTSFYDPEMRKTRTFQKDIIRTYTSKVGFLGDLVSFAIDIDFTKVSIKSGDFILLQHTNGPVNSTFKVLCFKNTPGDPDNPILSTINIDDLIYTSNITIDENLFNNIEQSLRNAGFVVSRENKKFTIYSDKQLRNIKVSNIDLLEFSKYEELDNRIVSWGYSDDILNTPSNPNDYFYKIDSDGSKKILGNYYGRVDFFSKLIGKSKDQISITVESLSEKEVRVTIEKLNYSEYFEGYIDYSPSKEGEIRCIENIINANSKLVYCRIHRYYHHYINELGKVIEEEYFIPFPEGTWKLSGGYVESISPQTRWNGLKAMEFTNVQEDFLLIQNISNWRIYPISQDLDYYSEYRDLLDYAQLKNTQVLIQNNDLCRIEKIEINKDDYQYDLDNPPLFIYRLSGKYISTNGNIIENPEELTDNRIEIIIDNTNKNLFYWIGDHYYDYTGKDVTDDREYAFPLGMDFFFNYTDDKTNRLIYFYSDFLVNGTIPRPGYYYFLRGCFLNNWELQNRLIFTDTLEEEPIFETNAFTDFLQSKKSNFPSLFDNQYSYKKFFWDTNGTGDYESSGTLKFVQSRISRMFERKKWNILGYQNYRDRDSFVRSMLDGINWQNTSLIYSISLNSISLEEQNQKMIIKLTLRTREFLEKDIKLNITLNYIY